MIPPMQQDPAAHLQDPAAHLQDPAAHLQDPDLHQEPVPDPPLAPAAPIMADPAPMHEEKSQRPAFSGQRQDFQAFSFLFKTWAVPRELWDFYVDPPDRPADAGPEQARWDRLNERAFSEIVGACMQDINVAMSLEEFEGRRPPAIAGQPRPAAVPARPADAWQYLQLTYRGVPAIQQQEALTKLQSLKMLPEETASSYWQRASGLRRQYLSAGGQLGDLSFLTMVQQGLPMPKYSIFATLRNNDLDQITLQQYQEQLCRQGAALDHQEATGSAFWSQGGNSNSGSGRSRNDIGSPGGARQHGGSPGVPKVLGKDGEWGKLGFAPQGCCHGCHIPGHRWQDCRRRPGREVPECIQKLNQNNRRPRARANPAEGGHDSEQADRPPSSPASGDATHSSNASGALGTGSTYVVTAEAHFGSSNGAVSHSFHVDSGATHHMDPVLSDFSGKLRPPPVSHVTVGSGERLPVGGAGEVYLTGHNGVQFRLGEVLYVPGLKVRLMSVPTLTSRGLGLNFLGATATAMDGKNIIFHSERQQDGALYKAHVQLRHPPGYEKPSPEHAAAYLTAADINETQSIGCALAAMASLTPVELLHQRMGHAAPSTLAIMNQQGALQGLSTAVRPEDFKTMSPCQPCLLGKAHAQPFPAAATRVSAHPLSLVHIDLHGPVRAPAAGTNAIYTLDLVDDKTRYVWSIPLPTKESATVQAALEDWLAQAERQSQQRLVAIRTDGGKEFLGAVSTWLQGLGVTRELSAPYSPAQNGVVERWHRTMMEGVRTLLLHSGLPVSFWAEALQHVVYLKNRTLHRFLPPATPTPYHAWTGHPADLSMVRVFGTMGCVTLPAPAQQQEGKLGTRGVMCCNLGVDPRAKAWRMYDFALKRVRISTHVVHLESLPYRDWAAARKGGDMLVESPEAVLQLLPPAPVGTSPDPDEELQDLGASAAPQVRRSERIASLAARRAAVQPGIPEATEQEEQAAAQELSGHQRAPAVAHQQAQQQPRAAAVQPSAQQQLQPPSTACEDPDCMPYVVALAAPQQPTPGSSRYNDMLLEQLGGEQAAAYIVLGEHFQAMGTTGDGLADDLMLGDWASGSWFGEVYLISGHNDNPQSAAEALAGPDAAAWRKGIQQEMGAMKEFGVFGDLVPLPPGRTAVDSKLLFVKKRSPAGEVLRYKVRLVARGFSQRPGEDYGETFASVTKHPAVRLILALVASEDWEAHVVDVNNAFLNAPLTEEIYLQQPQGTNDGSGRVYRLQKALYGLKQAPRLWSEELGKHLEAHGFVRSTADDALFMKWGPAAGDFAFIPTWVDDCLIVSNTLQGIQEAKEILSKGFSIKDLGEVSTYLGMQISRNRSKGYLDISLEPYIKGLEARFQEELAAVAGRCQTPMSPDLLAKIRKQESWSKEEAAPVSRTLFLGLLGCLHYCSGTQRPDIAHTTSILAQSSADPRAIHFKAAAHALKYLVQTKELVLRYTRGQRQHASLVVGYTDSDWAGEPSGQSRSAYVFMAGGAALSWYTKKLDGIGASTAEVEYKALSTGAKEAIWFRRLLEDLQLPCPAVPLFCDNQAALKIAANPVMHTKTRHIRVQQHTVRQALKDGEVEVHFVPSALQVADVLTKALKTAAAHKAAVSQLGLVQP